MSRRPKNVIAVTPAGDITLDHLLGFYAMFYIPNEPVSAWKLQRLWTAAGFDPGLIPRSRDPKHNFQVSCRTVETRRRQRGGDNHFSEIKSDQVLENSDEVIYQITHMVRDEANRQIEHPKMMRVTFDRKDEKIEWEAIDPGFEKGVLSDIGHSITNHYEKNAKKVPGQRVRTAVRKIIKELGGTNVRRKGGGVYFCPKEAKDDLDKLDEILADLYDGEADIHLIFAANADAERNLVEQHFTFNVSSEIDELMAEVTEELGSEGRKMRKDRVANILRERNILGEHREKYSRLLGTTLEEIGTKLDLLDGQLESLVAHIPPADDED